MSFKHHDEARKDAIEACRELLSKRPTSKAVLLDDLYGKYRLILWPGEEPAEALAATAKTSLAEAAASYWSDSIWMKQLRHQLFHMRKAEQIMVRIS